jgi:hypothetical protein
MHFIFMLVFAGGGGVKPITSSCFMRLMSKYIFFNLCNIKANLYETIENLSIL